MRTEIGGKFVIARGGTLFWDRGGVTVEKVTRTTSDDNSSGITLFLGILGDTFTAAFLGIIATKKKFKFLRPRGEHQYPTSSWLIYQSRITCE